MSAALCADVGAAHGHDLPGGVKREFPLLPAVPRRVRLRRKTPPPVFVENDPDAASQFPGELPAGAFLRESGVLEASAFGRPAPLKTLEEGLECRATLARYKRWAMKDMIASGYIPRNVRPGTPLGQEQMNQAWKARYMPSQESREWRDHLQRWQESPMPRPSYGARPESDVHRHVDLVSQRRPSSRQREDESKTERRLISSLCTYNGEWGKITDWSVSDRLLDEVSVLRHDRTPQERQAIAITTMCAELLSRSPQVAALWKTLCERLPQRLQAMHIHQWACSLELCPHTFLESRVLRVHVHLYAHFGKDKRKLTSLEKDLRIFGSTPRISQDQVGHVLQARTAGPNAAMYYLQCPKIGMLHYMGSRLPFSGYLVNGEWIMNMVQSGKMEASKARGEIVRTAKRLTAMLDNLDRWVRETRSAHLRMVEAALRIELTKKAQPFRTLEPVAQWQKQYAQEKQRYKFLVLDGLSGMGGQDAVHRFFRARLCGARGSPEAE